MTFQSLTSSRTSAVERESKPDRRPAKMLARRERPRHHAHRRAARLAEEAPDPRHRAPGGISRTRWSALLPLDEAVTVNPQSVALVRTDPAGHAMSRSRLVDRGHKLDVERKTDHTSVVSDSFSQSRPGQRRGGVRLPAHLFTSDPSRLLSPNSLHQRVRRSTSWPVMGSGGGCIKLLDRKSR
jgi:hypothetical protein